MTDRREEGFALVTALWFVALLALVAVIVEGWVSSALGRAVALKERAAAHGILVSVADRVAFTLLTGGFSPRGLELVPPDPAAPAPRPGATGAAVFPDTAFIALDGRPYRVGNALVRLQDAGGLYDLSNPNRQTLATLLASYGVGATEAEAVTEALIDYRGKSAATEAGDAEYLREGLPPPRHAPLLTPWELLRVVGWPRTRAIWQPPDSLAELVTTGPVGGLNLNTAPLCLLAAVAGMDEKEAARFIASRALHPIADSADITAATGLTPGEDRPLSIMPSTIVRMEITVAGDPLSHTIAVRLTPTDPAPYRINFAVEMPQTAASRGPVSGATLPEPAAGPAMR